MSETARCGICGTELALPLPPACPSCFNPPTATTRALVGVGVADSTAGTASHDPVDPSSRGPACATPGCSGEVLPGQQLCPTCDLLGRPSGLAYVLRGRWGNVDVPPGTTVTLGRSPLDAPATSSMLAAADRVSRIHADVVNDGGTLKITDGSTNGTTVNGERLRTGEERILLDGDRVVLGTQVEFEVVGSG